MRRGSVNDVFLDEDFPQMEQRIPAGTLSSRRMGSRESEVSSQQESSQQTQKNPKSSYFARNIKKREALIKKGPSSAMKPKTPLKTDKKSPTRTSQLFQTPQDSVISTPPFSSGGQNNSDIEDADVEDSFDELSKEAILAEKKKIKEREHRKKMSEQLSNASRPPFSSGNAAIQSHFQNNMQGPIELMRPVPIEARKNVRTPAIPAVVHNNNDANEQQKSPDKNNQAIPKPIARANTELMKRFEKTNASIDLRNPRFSARNLQRTISSPVTPQRELLRSRGDDLLLPPNEGSDVQYMNIKQKKKSAPQVKISSNAIDSFFAASAYAIAENFTPAKSDTSSLKSKSSEIESRALNSYQSLKTLSNQASALEDKLSGASYQFSMMYSTISELSQKTSMIEDKVDILLDKMDMSNEATGFVTVSLQYIIKVVAILYWIVMSIVGIFMAPFRKRRKMSFIDAQKKLNRRMSSYANDSETETETDTGTGTGTGTGS